MIDASTVDPMPDPDADKALGVTVEVPPDDRPKVWKATDLKPAAQPRWLAKNRLPRAAISLLIGDEGIGKSLLWVWIVAAITTGKALAEFGIPVRDPAAILLVVTEDDWSTVVLPRLIVAGADLSMIQVICTERDGSGAPIFPRDDYLIHEAEPVPALVVVDAWLDTVSAGLSVRDPQQARQALAPWKEVATATDAAVLLLCHTNRVASGNPRDRYGATGVLRQKARMTLYAQQDDEGRLVVGPEKANSTAPIPASMFTITPVKHFTATADHDGTVPLLTYGGESDRTVGEHVAASVEVGGDEVGGSPAKAFVYDYVFGQGGEAAAADVLKAGRTAGFSDQELKDARRRHRKPRIESRKASFGDGWVWAISTDQDGTPPQGGNQTRQGGEDGTQGDKRPISPPSPPWPPSQIIPGGITADTPGQTDRMNRALSTGRASTPSVCPDCQRAPARSDSGQCDFCSVKAQRRGDGAA